MRFQPCLPGPGGHWQRYVELEKVTVARLIHLLLSIRTLDLFLNSMMVRKTDNTHHNNEEHPVHNVNALLSVQTT